MQEYTALFKNNCIRKVEMTTANVQGKSITNWKVTIKGENNVQITNQ